MGLCFPFIFILLDLKQLGLTFDFTNMYEVFKSQNIYFFSSILFPLLFAIIGGLFFHTFSQNKTLSEQEAYIKNVLDSLIDCILVCDSNGSIQYANRSFYNTYNNQFISIKSLLGIQDLSVIPSEQFIEIDLLNKKGERRSVNFIVHKLNHKHTFQRMSDSYIVSIRDIDELKKNETIIATQKAQLFESSKLSALGEMASGFAHEINNPLAIINGHVTQIERELKKDETNREAALKSLETCKVTIMRITKIISGLRNLSTSKIGDWELVSIKDLIEDSVVMANLKISGKGIDFRLDIAAVENHQIVCNPIQISQVLMNLFTNAIYVIEDLENPWFSLTVELINNEYKFSVMDSGNGIPLDVQKRMFEPMFTTKPVGKGTGLGLTISRAIIEKHKGRMSLNPNSPNTCFEIVLQKNFESKSAA